MNFFQKRIFIQVNFVGFIKNKLTMINSGIPVGNRPSDHFGIMGNNEQPWMPIEAINFLEKNIKKEHVGFEFGCGSSTFWFSKISKEIFSIESDINWYNIIEEKIKINDIKNINLFHISCEMKYLWDFDYEIGGNYNLYSDYIFNLDVFFDYIIVDGVARSLCIENSIKKIKNEGYLIIDNAERPAYSNAISKIPKEWELFEFTNSVDKTQIFKKI